jgi:hypothetical protein
MDALDPKLVEHVARAICGQFYPSPDLLLTHGAATSMGVPIWRTFTAHAEAAIRATDKYRSSHPIPSPAPAEPPVSAA